MGIQVLLDEAEPVFLELDVGKVNATRGRDDVLRGLDKLECGKFVNLVFFHFDSPLFRVCVGCLTVSVDGARKRGERTVCARLNLIEVRVCIHRECADGGAS